MNIVNKKEPILLFFGDLTIFVSSIWITLWIRHLSFPTNEIFVHHLKPFAVLIVLWFVVLYIAGLYDRFSSVMWRKIPQTLFNAQIVNIVIAIIFFYFIPYFYITPKTILFIYLVVSLILLTSWRLFIYPEISFMEKQNAILIARGEEMKELKDEINRGNYGYVFSSFIDLDNTESIDVQKDIVSEVYTKGSRIVVIDTQDDTVIPLLSHLYNLMFSKVNFVDMHTVYEQVFGRIPLSLVKHGWFLQNVTTEAYVVYEGLKRMTDFILSLIMFVISLVFYPFIILLIKIDDRGSIFFKQERIGQDNKKFNIYKFRTMSDPDGEKVTRVGKFLRNTRLDELPQLINIMKGELSLIGPRPEISSLASLYADQIPYYNVRHLIKPGLSGWAQIYHENHPHHVADIGETRNKLSYDLYYIKNRSIFLDIKVALKTLNILFMRQGR